ncbi:MAG: hypothetical protein WBZ36_05780 [Candidatus Nitrosopolaris sp.]
MTRTTSGHSKKINTLRITGISIAAISDVAYMTCHGTDTKHMDKDNGFSI